MKRVSSILMIAAGVILLASAVSGWWLYLTADRYEVVLTSRGVVYQIDRRTGQSWVLHGVRKIPLDDEAVATAP